MCNHHLPVMHPVADANSMQTGATLPEYGVTLIISHALQTGLAQHVLLHFSTASSSGHEGSMLNSTSGVSAQLPRAVLLQPKEARAGLYSGQSTDGAGALEAR